jgi:hypothetical protein
VLYQCGSLNGCISIVKSPKKRSELSAAERKSDCIIDIAKLKKREVNCYKPSDLWTQEDDLLFLKWVTDKLDRAITSWPETYQTSS